MKDWTSGDETTSKGQCKDAKIHVVLRHSLRLKSFHSSKRVVCPRPKEDGSCLREWCEEHSANDPKCDPQTHAGNATRKIRFAFEESKLLSAMWDKLDNSSFVIMTEPQYFDRGRKTQLQLGIINVGCNLCSQLSFMSRSTT